MQYVSNKNILGFTLIELLVAIAVISILSAIAIPSYSHYVVRSKLSEVGSVLSVARLQQAQFYADNRNYGTPGGACGTALPTAQYFTLACACAAGTTCQSYTLTATSKADQGLGVASDYVYTLTDTNAKSTSKFAGSTVALADWKIK